MRIAVVPNQVKIENDALVKTVSQQLAQLGHLGAASPILSQGDLMGCVLLLLGENDKPLQESDQCLARTAAGFLGKQLES